ncbi:helix-turn-helix domain-containing protein [Streptomyces noursei]|uniref:helix-turn-helix domain-containing protein n=1 Tax=Streptomyces noursei TaxID=1971 RepID=UPI003B969443
MVSRLSPDLDLGGGRGTSTECFRTAGQHGRGTSASAISRSAKDRVRSRRAIAVLMSTQGQTAKDIASLMQVSQDYVRDVIHAFNERAFDALDPKWNGDAPRRSVSGCASTSARCTGSWPCTTPRRPTGG